MTKRFLEFKSAIRNVPQTDGDTIRDLQLLVDQAGHGSNFRLLTPIESDQNVTACTEVKSGLETVPNFTQSANDDGAADNLTDVGVMTDKAAGFFDRGLAADQDDRALPGTQTEERVL